MHRRPRQPLLTLFALCAALGVPLTAGAAPITSATITGWTDSSLNVIVDGTSNTILFGEQTVVTTCLSQVSSLGNITDGTSNTISFGETTDVCFEEASRLPVTRTTRPGVTDGTSNTILLTEDGTGYFFGGGARIDVCVTNASIADGTSNTILLSETGAACFTDAEFVPSAPDGVPEPALTVMLAASVLAGWTSRRRRRRIH